jgi:hypothetical protein
MPTKGYRKGQSDTLEPFPRFLRTRLTEREHQALKEDAQRRSMTMSKLTRAIVAAHLTGQRAQLAHPDRTSALLREFARVGNNLNQLAHQANAGLVAISTEELRRCLDRLNDLARRYG